MRFVHGHNGVKPVRERLFSQLVLHPSGCLLWTGTIDDDGYGQISIRGKKQLVHRVMWRMFEGPIPDDRPFLDHVKERGCHYRNCANVAHLEPVTNRENLLRGDTIPAAYAARSGCDNGHEFTELNTRWRGGTRVCRQCQRDRRPMQAGGSR